MKKSQIIKQIIAKSCILFTIISTLTYTLSAIFSGKIDGWIPKLDLIYMLLIFSFAIIISNYILRKQTISLALRILIHFIVLGVVYYLLFVVWGGFATNAGTTLIALLLYFVAYIITMIIVLIVTKSKKAKANKDEEYTSMISKD